MNNDSPAAIIVDSTGANIAAVKAASTAAVAADKALVVAVSPNNTIPVSAAALPLPTGAATETTLAAINTKTLAAGQAAMAASSPVVIASNQSAVPVSGPLTDAQMRATPVPAVLESEGVSAVDTPTKVLAIGALDVFDQIHSLRMHEMATAPALGPDGALAVSWRKTALGQSVEYGTSTNPVRTDPTGTTAQPVSSITTSVTPGTAAANLGKAEDAAHNSGDVGVMGLAVRKATPANLSGADGDYEPLQMSAGRLWASATIEDGGGSITVDGPLTDAQLRASRVPAELESEGATGPVALPGKAMQIGGISDANELQVPRIYEVTAGGAGVEGVLGVSWRKIAAFGSTEYGSSGTPVRTDPTGTTTQPVSGTVAIGTSVTPGTAATNLGKAEDAVHATGDVGVMGLAVQKATPANLAGTDGDYEPLQVSAGRLWASATITSIVPGTAATNLGKAEDAVHSTGDVGVMALGVVNTANSNRASAELDYAALTTDLSGALRVMQEPRESLPFVSFARTTTQTLSDQVNLFGKGIVVVLDVTIAGTGSITLEIQWKDPSSLKYIALLTGVAVTTNSTNVYRIYPGLTAVANATVSDLLPRTWRIVVTANNANTITYSVGAVVMP